MQLIPAHPARVFVGLALVLAGSELFLRYSSVTGLKIASFSLAFAGVLLIAWPSANRSNLASRIAAGTLFVLYVVQASWRYPGLLKDELGPPSAMVDLAILAAEAAVVFAASVGFASFLLRVFRRQVSPS